MCAFMYVCVCESKGEKDSEEKLGCRRGRERSCLPPQPSPPPPPPFPSLLCVLQYSAEILDGSDCPIQPFT